MSAILNLTEAKAKFSEVVERVSRARRSSLRAWGTRRVQITRYEPGAANRRLGLLEGRIRIAEDFDIWP